MPRLNKFDYGDEEDKNMKDVAKKALYAGAVGTAAAYFLGESGNASFLGVQMNAPLVVGVGTASGSVVGDLASGYLINSLDQSSDMKSIESTAIKLGLSGAGTVLALKVGANSNPTMEGFLLGSASKFVGDGIFTEADVIGMLF